MQSHTNMNWNYVLVGFKDFLFLAHSIWMCINFIYIMFDVYHFHIYDFFDIHHFHKLQVLFKNVGMCIIFLHIVSYVYTTLVHPRPLLVCRDAHHFNAHSSTRPIVYIEPTERAPLSYTPSLSRYVEMCTTFVHIILYTRNECAPLSYTSDPLDMYHFLTYQF